MAHIHTQIHLHISMSSLYFFELWVFYSVTIFNVTKRWVVVVFTCFSFRPPASSGHGFLIPYISVGSCPPPRLFGSADTHHTRIVRRLSMSYNGKLNVNAIRDRDCNFLLTTFLFRFHIYILPLPLSTSGPLDRIMHRLITSVPGLRISLSARLCFSYLSGRVLLRSKINFT